ncbi:MAG: hypothetical protein A3K77_06055 [Euryarchaeota archaeon RBG_13_31_8]|nr:MAG: hypothetical protein A3K77_06055 [Euryarchaeota archaeon RBG_13_31_8]
MLRNSTQYYLYHKQKEKEQFGKFLNFLKKGIFLLIAFNSIEQLRLYLFPNIEFGLSFMFWGVCLILCFYWLPTKKEYGIWKKKNGYFLGLT